ncbi:hypothetical protein INT45_013077 [Circinella minor]|uniref:Uncharacterized protein n=1 Tax=Circinella minor TaxID=1195481 RepID=A0A8H7S0F1_9FUNG|nr:hypothetical protein INT45_013077 [Circinella minor]
MQSAPCTVIDRPSGNVTTEQANTDLRRVQRLAYTDTIGLPTDLFLRIDASPKVKHMKEVVVVVLTEVLNCFYYMSFAQEPEQLQVAIQSPEHGTWTLQTDSDDSLNNDGFTLVTSQDSNTDESQRCAFRTISYIHNDMLEHMNHSRSYMPHPKKLAFQSLNIMVR